MRILCIGDSLGLPREYVNYEDTWFYKLQKKYPNIEFVDMFERGLLITKAYENFDSYYLFYPSDIVIIQTGICDCAPRYIDERKFYVKIAKFIFRKLGLISIFWKIAKLKGRKSTCVSTSIESFCIFFCKLLDEILENGTKYIIVIKIGHATESVIKRNPLLNSNVDKYNEEIEKICNTHKDRVKVINPLDIALDKLFVDGYHCNNVGMNVVYNNLVEVLEELIN